MGRFATTVTLYEELRPPYPPAFFRRVARELGFRREHALIDLGTGPGLLALGFAPYVGRVVGVDPEPAMIAAARTAAARASTALPLIEGKAEALPADVGSFDIVTIGRALHWMERDATLALLERLVASDGVILICSSHSALDGSNLWLDEFNSARRAWSQESLWSEAAKGAKTHRDLAGFFAGSRFHLKTPVTTETSHEVGVNDLARRVLTYSSSSPEVLGDRVEAMLRDMEQRLLPFSRNGVVTEAFVSVAQVAKR
jgi:ubiquinone/menaquinone biosynthesis C-methylase UbiE